MKESWTLTVKSSLPDVCEDDNDLKTTVSVFDSFDAARTAMREAIRGFAFSENSMFDGNGQLKEFNHFIETSYTDEFDDDEDMEEYLIKKNLIKIRDALTEIFSGKEIKPPLKPKRYTDECYLSVTIKKDSISLRGAYEGPENGIEPKIKTNILSMQKEQNYYLYIDDMFAGDVKPSSELYIDLIKAETN